MSRGFETAFNLVQKFLTRGQFHQRFTSSFYARRSQKRQKDSQVKQIFALLGSLQA